MSNATLLDLQDLCIAIDEDGSISSEDLATRLKCSYRTIQRRFTQIDELGIGVERYRNEDEQFIVELQKPLHIILDNLDQAMGVRPFPVPSILSKEAQESVKELYQDIINGKLRRWPDGYFDDDNMRPELLRVIIPNAYECSLIQKTLSRTYYSDLVKAKLGGY